MQCRKTAPSAGHFRSIAPKILPKVVPTTPLSTPALPDSVVSGVSTKPLVMPAQNYTLMKVPGQNGTFSFVAVPQVGSMGAAVIQTTGIPLQENLKLPIPRCQSARRRLCDKKVKAASSVRVLKSDRIEPPLAHEGHAEASPKFDASDIEIASHTTVTSEEVIIDCNVGSSALLSVNAVDHLSVGTSALSYIKKEVPKIFSAGSPVKKAVHPKKAPSTVDNGPMVACESNKVVDSSLTVLSPVVFGSPLHLFSSAHDGKLPIMPYLKSKKSIIPTGKEPPKNTAMGPAFDASPEIGKEDCLTQSDDFPVHVGPSSLTPSALVDPRPSNSEPDSPNVTKPNGALGKRRGRKRKTPGDMRTFQSKMKLVGNKLLVCQDKLRLQVFDPNVKKPVCTKQYRSIMPKPVLEVQGLAHFGPCVATLPTQPMDLMPRNRFQQLRSYRWRQVDSFSVKQCPEGKKASMRIKACFRCHICEHNFQFKHHLQDHMNTHTNRRPYHCRLCRKSYVHSGSLSTHMKLHHSESRLKKLMCCEFCAKVFGHIKVYFGHLKEVHRVIISTEVSAKQLEKSDATKANETAPVEKDNCSTKEEDSFYRQADGIKLQIKCGRCNATTPTFSDMKLHLLCEHGDKFQETLQEGILESRQGAQEEVVKQATHYWKLLNERRSLYKCSTCEEEFLCTSKLRRHVCFSQVDHAEREQPKDGHIDISSDDHGRSLEITEVCLQSGNQLNCLLCRRVFEAREQLLAHWQESHNCENPMLLWTLFSSLPKAK
uniref:Zinc finger protein 438 n=1 Tax=Leptobrachium leishanense TaxID=445787 RepID=A0A8C5PBL3_9ANUR